MSDAPTGPGELSLEADRIDIIARLRNHPRLRGIGVFRGQLTDGEAPTVDESKLINGYVCVVFGGRGKVRNSWKGITGTRDDLRSWIFGVEVYGRDSESKDRISDDVMEILEGYVSIHTTELECTFSGAIQNPLSTMASISREGVGMLFDTTIDMGVSSYLAPTP